MNLIHTNYWKKKHHIICFKQVDIQHVIHYTRLYRKVVHLFSLFRMIGLQLGTLIAQVVIIGDLGPAIVSKATGLQNTNGLRTGLILFLCLFIGLPLALLKDLRTLSKTSSLCIAFYTFFTVYVSLIKVILLITLICLNFW